MNIGKMNKRVELQGHTNIPDGMGGFKKDITRTTVWAEFKRPRFTTNVENGAVTSVVTIEIAIRYRTDIKKGWHVLYDNRTLNVDYTYELDKTTTTLVCREVVL